MSPSLKFELLRDILVGDRQKTKFFGRVARWQSNQYRQRAVAAALQNR